jgi:TolA-binding protein
MRFLLPLLSCWLLTALCARSASTAEQNVEVSPEIASVLRAAQEEDNPAKALERLRAYKGKPHALISLMTGQMTYRLAQQDAPHQAAHREAAEKAYVHALELDPNLRQAALGLAQIAADRGEWPQAVTRCAQAIDVNAASPAELLFYTQASYQAHDWRLATTLIGQGIMRFPHELGFRRLELAMLVQSERAGEAGLAIRALLAQSPDDTDLWRNLSWAKQSCGEERDALVGLEAACLTKPDDRDLARRLGDAQLGQHMPQAAFETFRHLIGEPPLAEAVADARLMESAARAAADSGEIAQARTWLAAVPEKQRTRAQRLLAARLAVQSGDSAGADAAIRAVIDLGERDPAVLTWAGHLAEQAHDDARAEALYNQAATADGAAAGTATLRLVALLHRQQRMDEATTLVASHLAKYPNDQQALALRAALAARLQEQRR